MEEVDANVIANLRRFLREVDIVAVGCVDPQGLPYVANLYVAADEQLRFYFVSDPTAWHSKCIQRVPTISLAGHAPIRMWQQVRGIQVQGECHALPESQRDAAWAIYLDRFPHMQEIAEHIRAMTFYCITPSKIRWIDNSVHFGYQVEMDWPLPDHAQLNEQRRGLV